MIRIKFINLIAKAVKTTLISIFALFQFANIAIAGLGQWTSNGPDGGHVYDLAADPVVANTIYTVTRGGVFKSLDAGITWMAINNGLTTNFISKATHHSTESGTMYVSGGLSVFKTTDGGLNWNRVNSGLPTTGDRITDIKLAPSVPETIYAGTAVNGMFKSINGGVSWLPINTGLMTLVNGMAINSSNSNQVYAAVSGTLNGLYVTNDGGDNWTDISSAIPAPYSVGEKVKNVTFTKVAGELFILADSGVYKSTDSGASWVFLQFVSGTNITSNPSDETEIIVSGFLGLTTTNDGGASWVQVESVFEGSARGASNSTVVLFDPFDTTNKFAGTSSNGVYKKTSSGPEWLPNVKGMNSESIRGLAIANYPDSSSRIFAGIGDIFDHAYVSFISDDKGVTWSQNNLGLDATSFREIEVDPFTTADIASTHVYAVGIDTVFYDGTTNGNGGIYKSTDGGDSWNSIDNGIPFNAGPPMYSLLGTVRDISLDLNNTGANGNVLTLYIAASGKFGSDGIGGFTDKLAARIYKSTDAGANWTESDTGIDIPTGASSVFPRAVKVIVDPSDSMKLYAATFIPNINSTTMTVKNGVWKSIDAGANWTHSSIGMPRVGAVGTTNFSVLSLDIDPNSPNRLYASVHDPDTSESHVYKSEDSAVTWVISNDGVATSDVRDILVAANGDAYVAAAGNSGNPGGIYRSQDNGITWQSMSIGLDSIAAALQLDIDETGINSVLYAGSHQSVQSFEIIPDGDTDGVSDSTEAAAPSSGDANMDGTADSEQNNVSSLLATSVDSNIITKAISATDYVTVEVMAVTGTCDTLEDVQSLADESIPDDYKRAFNHGILRFEIVDCAEANVEISFHGATDFLDSDWSFRIFAPLVSGTSDFLWQDMPASVTGKKWTINLKDGQFGDVRPNNGRILFQGGPGLFESTVFSDGFETTL